MSLHLGFRFSFVCFFGARMNLALNYIMHDFIKGELLSTRYLTRHYNTSHGNLSVKCRLFSDDISFFLVDVVKNRTST